MNEDLQDEIDFVIGNLIDCIIEQNEHNFEGDEMDFRKEIWNYIHFISEPE